MEDLKAVEVCYPIHEFGLHNFYILKLELFQIDCISLFAMCWPNLPCIESEHSTAQVAFDLIDEDSNGVICQAELAGS